MADGIVPTNWHEFDSNKWSTVSAQMIEEALVTVYLNGKEILTIMCTPTNQDHLALGFLKNEGLIGNIDEVETITISEDGCCVEIWLDHAVDIPENKIKTSGCGGGTTYNDPGADHAELLSDLTIDPTILFQQFNSLQAPNSLYARARGVHSAGLYSPNEKKFLITNEDVGRHNTIDKLVGFCLMNEIQTTNQVLLVTGRISSEMVLKSVRMGCPIIASRNSPTSLAVDLAKQANIALIGYVRRKSMRVYTHPWRLGYDEINLSIEELT